MTRILAIALVAGTAAAQDSIWDAGTGVWSSPTNWLANDVADQPTENALFGGAAAYTVTIDGSFDIASLQNTNANVAIDLEGGHTLTINGPFCNLFGPLTLNSNNSASNAVLRFAADCTLQSSGGIRLVRQGEDTQLIGDPGVTLTIQTGPSIRGVGIIRCAIDNSGDIVADVGGQTLEISVHDIDNRRTLMATDGGTLRIVGIDVPQSQAGWITADGGDVDLVGVDVFERGLTAMNGGVITTTSGSSFTNVTLDGTTRIPGGNTLAIDGPLLMHEGTLTVNHNNSAANGVLRFRSDTVIEGFGEFRLVRTGEDTQITLDPGVTLEHRTNHTIAGSGNIQGGAIFNHGSILGDQASGTLRSIGVQYTNNGLFRATGGGRVRFTDTQVDQSGIAVIETTSGGQIEFEDATIIDGIVRVADGSGRNEQTNLFRSNHIVLDTDGLWTLANGTTTFETLQSFVMDGVLQVNGGTTLRLDTPDVPNDGLIVLNANNSASNVVMLLDRPVTFSGTGDLDLVRQGEDTQVRGQQLTNGPDHTIRGQGDLDLPVVNFGLIVANDLSTSIRFFEHTLLNENLLRNETGGVLDFDGTSITQGASGRIESNDGRVDYALVDITGGRLAGAQHHDVTGSSSLTDVVVEADLQVRGGVTLDVDGPAYRNDATIIVNSNNSSANGRLRVGSGATLAGTGEVVMIRQGEDTQLISDGSTIVNEATHTIRGVGDIQAPFRNEGLVHNDRVGELQFRNTVENNAVILADGGGTLRFTGGTVTQGAGGSITAIDGNARVVATNITGGLVESQNASIELSQGCMLDMLTLEGMAIQAGGNTTTFGAVENNALFILNSNNSAANAVLLVGATGLQGTGEVRMIRAGEDTQVRAAGTPDVLNGVGHTLSGRGDIMDPLINDGIVHAGTPVGTLQARDGFEQTASGELRATLGDGPSGVLAVTGDAIIDGTLRATLADGFIPQVGDEWVVLTTTGSVVGAFDDVDVPDLGILSIRPIVTANEVRLTTRCTVDLAEPFGTLDIFDVLEFLNLFQIEDPFADLADPSGVYDIFDIIEFLGYFEQGC